MPVGIQRLVHVIGIIVPFGMILMLVTILVMVMVMLLLGGHRVTDLSTPNRRLVGFVALADAQLVWVQSQSVPVAFFETKFANHALLSDGEVKCRSRFSCLNRGAGVEIPR